MVISAKENNRVVKGCGESEVGREGGCNLNRVVRIDLGGVFK